MEDEVNMNDAIPEFINGQFLIAMPSLGDPFFSKSVTCICEHKKEGAFGIIINQVYPDIDEKLFFEGLNLKYEGHNESKKIHIGGPVQRNNVFVIHGPPFGWTNCFKVTDNIALSSTLDILQAITKNEGPEQHLIATGCAGWAPDQLESEMQRNSWITSPLNEELLFETAVEKRWEISMKLIGIDPHSLSENFGHA